MEEKLLNDYARLIARQGGHVVKGDEVWLYAGLDQPEFVTKVVEECYKAGAKSVFVEWEHDPTFKLDYKYASLATLSKVTPMTIAKLKYRLKKLPTMIYISSEDPDAFNGVNQEKMAKSRMRRYPKIKKYFDAMDGKYKWCLPRFKRRRCC